MFTTVKEELFRGIALLLVAEKYAPAWFADIEYIHWTGTVKDLRFIPNARIDEVLLVDDYKPYIQADQKSNWLEIDYFEYPYSMNDTGLSKIMKQLEILFSIKN